MRWMVALAFWMLASNAVAASSLEDVAGVSSSPASEANPRTGSLFDRLTGTVEVTPQLTLDASLELTYDEPSRGKGQRFADRGGNVFLFALGGTYEPSSHLSLELQGFYSPSARQLSDARLTLPEGEAVQTVQGLLVTHASSEGGTFSLGLDSADPDDDEAEASFAAVLTVGATRRDLGQRITKVATPEEQALVEDYCSRVKRAACRALRGQTATLWELPVQLDLVTTLHQDTDLGLTGAYFFYDQDPGELGYYGVATAGRAGRAGLGLEGGFQLAPERYLVQPSIGNRFGPVGATLFGEYGEYVDQQGHEQSAGLRLRWRISAHWRITASATLTRSTPGVGLTRDLPPHSPGRLPVDSQAFTGGVRYTF